VGMGGVGKGGNVAIIFRTAGGSQMATVLNLAESIAIVSNNKPDNYINR